MENVEKLFLDFDKIIADKEPEESVVEKLDKSQIDTFYQTWEKEFISCRGRYRKQTIDRKKEKGYRDCLFQIYKYHWDEDNGFQINMENLGDDIHKSRQTVSRLIIFFLKCQLLFKCGNYFVGERTNLYHKNQVLFNYLYKEVTNEYQQWLESSNNMSYILTNRPVITNDIKSNCLLAA